VCDTLICDSDVCYFIEELTWLTSIIEDGFILVLLSIFDEDELGVLFVKFRCVNSAAFSEEDVCLLYTFVLIEMTRQEFSSQGSIHLRPKK
jgi:hypothetical protein